MSSNKHALVVTSSALLDHQLKSSALGPTANAPAVGSMYQSPAHDGDTNGAVILKSSTKKS